MEEGIDAKNGDDMARLKAFAAEVDLGTSVAPCG
jgi:hypothetical protein